jgi:pimeloyl-ACP methyl ester carboxylesterase
LLLPLLQVDPASHRPRQIGGDAADSFDVIVPSLPGYGFSEAREQNGDVFGFGDLWHKLMTDALGYSKFGAQAAIGGALLPSTSHAAMLLPSSVSIHLTDVPFWHIFQKPGDASATERKFLDENERWQKQDGAYAMIQGTRPRTAAIGLNDSPAGLASWIVEKFHEWSACNGDIESRFTLAHEHNDLLDYRDNRVVVPAIPRLHECGWLRWMQEAVKGWIGSSNTPAAFACFPKDISNPPHAWAERFFNVKRWTEMTSGGHFAALEEPERLAQDIREFFPPPPAWRVEAPLNSSSSFWIGGHFGIPARRRQSSALK